MIEVRQGATSTGISLDDLVDLVQGMGTKEFAQFCKRKNASSEELAKRALVLQTPVRSFSFIFSNTSSRDVLGQLLVYLLKAKKRGVMAEKTSISSQPLQEGFGRVVYPNNSSYEGQFHKYKRHGLGTLILPEGTTYVCEWRNDERHGKGEESWADGTTFRGNYAKGMRSGTGMMTWPEGSRYSGMFERGRANGHGELIRTDGSVYTGQFQQDCMAGEGHIRWKDGVEYRGEFAANRRHGHGKMVWKSGKWKSYEGAWKDGVQHGRGTLVDQHGFVSIGEFHQGKLSHWEELKAG